jgi:hypothetical protein
MRAKHREGKGRKIISIIYPQHTKIDWLGLMQGNLNMPAESKTALNYALTEMIQFSSKVGMNSSSLSCSSQRV